ncbi:MAG: molecular chaperone DnaJ [Candidatus Micrarchaeota archaeon]
MAAKRDYYEILEVDKNASSSDIKKAYRKLAMKYHPDRSSDKDAEARFKEISEAYAVLSDETKRKQYDQYGHAGFDQMYSREDIFRNANFSGFEDIFGGNSPFGDMFSAMFGGGFGRRQMEVGADLEAQVEITLEEAAKGVKKDLHYHHSKTCPKCRGSRSEPGSSRKGCSACHGKGQVRQVRRMGPMAFQTIAPCRACHGEGSVVEKPCKECGGTGSRGAEEHIKVNIPAGIDSGMRIHLEGMGEYGKDGAGDLYVRVFVKEHRLFERQGEDLWLSVPVTYTQAALGDEVEVPALFGKLKLKIPAGTQSHTVFKLSGQGMPSLNGHGKGDEMVRIIIDVPKKITKKEKELLRELDREYGKKKKGFLGSVF